MSGVIRDLENLNSRQLDTLRRKNERELKFIKESHDTVKVEQKKTQENELIDLQHQGQNALSQEETKKQKVLESMKSHVNVTKEITDKQLKELEVKTAEEKNKLAEKLSISRERLVNDNELYLDDINHRFNTQNRKVVIDGQERITEADQNNKETYAHKQHEFQNRIALQTKHHTDKIRSDDARYQQLKTEQDKSFKHERKDTNLRQHAEMNKLTSTHESHKKVRDSEFKRDVRTQQHFHENRFTTVKNAHEGEFKNLSELNKKIINKSKAELASELTILADRQDDPFFQFRELRPKIKENADSIEVSVEVPDHSKKDMMLTLNKKEIVLTFNRRFVDVHKNEAGEQRINKVESLSNRIVTTHHLDAKSVKSNWEDGVMTYTIKKA